LLEDVPAATPARYVPWSAEDDAKLIEMSVGHSLPLAAQALGRSYHAARCRAQHLGLRFRKRKAQNNTGFAASHNDWSVTDIETLRSMLAKGKSAREIGEVLNRSRGAVIGKARRLGIPFPEPQTKAKHAPRPPKSRAVGFRVPRALIRFEPFVFADETPPEGAATFAELGPYLQACRWPFGDPRSDAFRYCNSKTHGHVYCDHHRHVAWRPRI
jgi:GcrA cell cycle regulator